MISSQKSKGHSSGQASGPGAGLQQSVDRLERTIRSIPEQHAILFDPMRNVFFTFVRGVAYGMGMLFAVVIVIPVIVALLQHIQWVPLIGEFVARILEHTETLMQRYP